MAEWSLHTCISFVEDSGSEYKKGIEFENFHGCMSRIGMSYFGWQNIGLHPACRRRYVILHEIGHALGLYHEHMRPDRDQNVEILLKNIRRVYMHNFIKKTRSDLRDLGMPYDYHSIMHYVKNAFSRNGELTIRTKDPEKQNVIGKDHTLSFGDVKAVNILYNCSRANASCTKDDSSCPGQGFVGKDCKCWCPGNPVKLCPETGDGSQGGQGTCTDSHNSCSSWASSGECQKNPSWMLKNCKKSCNPCNGGGECTDSHNSCSSWASTGECQKNPYWMLKNCKKSCNPCNGEGTNHGNNDGGEGTDNGNNDGEDTRVVCTSDDRLFCKNYSKSLCQHQEMRDLCPFFCGLCKKN